MSGIGKSDSNKLTSLLLQPPNSGFSWNEMSGGNILMPVSQTDSTTDDNADVDTFVGQSQPPKVGSQQPLADRVASNLQKSAQTTFVSQLQQPLRPPQSQGQVQSPPPVQSRGHSVFENSSTVQMQQQQQFLEQTAPGIAPPPMGESCHSWDLS